MAGEGGEKREDEPRPGPGGDPAAPPVRRRVTTAEKAERYRYHLVGREKHLAALIAGGMSYRAIAKKLGVGLRTVERAARRPVTVARVRELRDRAAAGAAAGLDLGAAEGVAALREVVRDAKATNADRTRAADALIRHQTRARELELMKLELAQLAGKVAELAAAQAAEAGR